MCRKQRKCYVNSQGKEDSVKELILAFFYSYVLYKHVVEITELRFSSLIYDTTENYIPTDIFQWFKAYFMSECYLSS